LAADLQGDPLMPIAAAPPPAQVASDSRSAVVCVRAAGPRPLFFTGKLVGKKPGSKPRAISSCR
jgi:hypothetical protein